VAFETPILDFTLLAAADLSASQFFFLAVNASGQAAIAGSGVATIGVLQNKPASGQAAQVRTEGITKCVAGAAVAAGALVMSDAAGKAITATSTNDASGVALTAAGALNDIITVKIATYGKR
jgi:hypothetical protein